MAKQVTKPVTPGTKPKPGAKPVVKPGAKPVVKPGAKPGAKAPVKVVPPKLNPLDQQVQSAIQGQINPYLNANAERQNQYTQDVADAGKVDTSLQAQLKQIQQGLESSNANALSLAAQQGTAVPDQMQRNQSFLREVLGNYTTNGGTGLDTAASQQGVIANANASGNAAAVGLAGSSGASQLAAQRGASAMAGGERAAQLLQQRMADVRATQNEIARIKGTAPLLARQFGQENGDRWLAAQELKLNRAQLAEQQRQFNTSFENLSAADAVSAAQQQQQLDAAAGAQTAEQIAAAAAAAEAAKKAKGAYGFGEQKDAAIGGVLASWKAALNGGKLKTPWQSLFSDLASVGGLTPSQAALMATKSYKQGLAGVARSPAGVQGVIAILASSGVSPAVQKFIITKSLGLKMPVAAKPGKPVKPTPVQQAQNSAGNVLDSAGNIFTGGSGSSGGNSVGVGPINLPLPDLNPFG